MAQKLFWTREYKNCLWLSPPVMGDCLSNPSNHE